MTIIIQDSNIVSSPLLNLWL